MVWLLTTPGSVEVVCLLSLALALCAICRRYGVLTVDAQDPSLIP